MLDKDELKIAIEDARARQAAVIQLQYFLDTQAMYFLRMFITIQAALVTYASGVGCLFVGARA